ncbi:MAG: hypothetical protein J6J00_12145 [Treponema sp.]|nr:hypothetical protein [Treponema sp.]
MKKLTVLLATLLIGRVLFAQNNTRKLITGVYSLVMEPTENWTIYDPNFTLIEPIKDKYEFEGSFILKIALGYMRYNFTCQITKNGDDITVTIPTMESCGCDKNGIITKGSKYRKTPDKVAAEYAKQIKDEILHRLSVWSDDEYTACLNRTVTSPYTIHCVQNNSALIFKKFISDYQVLGRNSNFEIYATRVDEAKINKETYSYVIYGIALAGSHKKGLATIPDTVHYEIYTNNDLALSLSVDDETQILINGGKGKKEAVYTINGTINEFKNNPSMVIEIFE